MSPNLCRLCFVEKPRLKPIEIFSVEGMELDVAAVIRLHFLDKVIESDSLPKSICRSCWALVRNFHTLYNTVNEVQSDFWSKHVKNEGPKLMQNDCDSEVCLEDISLVKSERLPDGFVAEIGNPSLENHEFEDNENENGSIGHVGVRTLFIDSDSEDESGNYDPNEVNVDKAATRKVAKNEKIIADSNEGNSEGKYDHLISEYMDMHCEICKHPFGSLFEARRHYLKQHKRNSAAVKCCKRRIQMTDILDHIQYHSNPNMFNCLKCSRTFTSGRELKKHQDLHLPKRFECDICQKKFSTITYVRSHMQKHSVGKHECDICKKSFKTKHALQYHVKCLHEQYYQTVCHICAKVCNSVSSLAQHLQEHSDIKRPRAICPVCGKSYTNEHTMRQHRQRQHESVPLQCPHCPKMSPNRCVLAGHIRGVHLFTVHKCHLCNKEFKRALALKEHVATHTGENLYNCPYCKKAFKSNASMYKHLNQIHPQEWQADKMAKQC